MTALATDSRTKSIFYILAAIGLATTQDAVMKSLAGTYPISETVMIRCGVAAIVFAIWLLSTSGISSLRTSYWRSLLLRSIIISSAYLAFILAIAAIPLANAGAIYFTMPFFVAALSWPILGERVPASRWIIIAMGFIGVLIMVQPGRDVFEPAALFALYSALGYAVSQMLGRKLAQNVPLAVMANWQNTALILMVIVIALLAKFIGFEGVTNKSLAFLTRPFIWPSFHDFLVLSGIGLLAVATMICFIQAYRYAQSNFVAPFEYSGMVWSIAFGVMFFNDFPDFWSWVGMSVIVGAGLAMVLLDRRDQTG
jgi:drug/metabolite transporter (DMT)-like permease